MTIAHSYQDGVGVAVDRSKAEDYFNLTAESQPNALMETGVMYYSGKVVPHELTKAVAMFRAGANRDHTHSVYWLSYLYGLGEGLPADNKKNRECEVAVASGIYYTGKSRGGSWLDPNGNGWLDLWSSNHGREPIPLRYQKDGTFIDIAQPSIPVDNWDSYSGPGAQP